METEEVQNQKLAQIFFPYVADRKKNIQNDALQFVHYTTAEAAMSIIQNQEVWMRNASCMNDFSEVQHGIECLTSAYNTDAAGKEFQIILNSISPGVTTLIEKTFNENCRDLPSKTYLTCFSEHDPTENTLGRLSMWRAYCNKSGVAIVMNNKAFFGGSTDLNVYTSPVEYLDHGGFSVAFRKMILNIQSEAEFLKTIRQDTVANFVCMMFIFAALSAKHPAFREEREWRLIHSSVFGNSLHLKKGIHSINGVPQTVYKIPLKNNPLAKLTDVEIPELINKIIIGPTEYSLTLQNTFIDLLRTAGVKNPAERVIVSNIPLRTG